MTDERFVHRPALLDAVIKELQPQKGGLFIDCTLGLGGHAEAMLSAAVEVKLVGIDRDEAAVELASKRLEKFGGRFLALRGDFKDLKSLLSDAEYACEPAAGILADLGVSSMQFDSAERGFSFQHGGPLDMRMDRRQKTTAADLVNSLKQEELADLIYEYGEERGSRAVARAIVKARTKKPIETTTELAEIAARALGGRGRQRIHPATRTFQALRIAVNAELEGLDSFVSDAVTMLAPGGRLAVITFHSLEDRIIKNAFRFESGLCRCPPRLPQCVCGALARVRLITKKPIVPDDREIEDNPRARSSKLRVCEKLEEAKT